MHASDSRLITLGTAILAVVCAVSGAHAQAPAEPPPPEERGEMEVAGPAVSEARRAAARRHFDNGVKLYQDRNYVGALAEFEAAYQAAPGRAALQNMALCKKALYRYAAAADDLEQLLERHGRELTSDAQETIREAIAELNAVTGRVVIVVWPRDARVNVDGEAIGAERARGMRLDVGEHTLTVSATGYATASRTLRVTAGPEPVVEQVTLEANTGFLSIEAGAPDASIEVDGKPVGRGRWEGRVPPGAHRVRVAQPGYQAFEQQVEAEAGRTTRVIAPSGSRHRRARSTLAATPTPTGWYALGTLALLAVVDQPRRLSYSGPFGESQFGGVGYGARVGYRISAPVAFELMASGSRQRVSGACDLDAAADPTYDCEGSHPFKRSYTLSTARLGPNIRILTKGDTVRLNAVAGTGAVRHKLRVYEAPGAPPNAFPDYNAAGWDPYLFLELGVERSFGHFSVGLDVHATIDATGNFEDGPYRPYGSLLGVGIGTRIGWAEWTAAGP